MGIKINSDCSRSACCVYSRNLRFLACVLKKVFCLKVLTNVEKIVSGSFIIKNLLCKNAKMIQSALNAYVSVYFKA